MRRGSYGTRWLARGSLLGLAEDDEARCRSDGLGRPHSGWIARADPDRSLVQVAGRAHRPHRQREEARKEPGGPGRALAPSEGNPALAESGGYGDAELDRHVRGELAVEGHDHVSVEGQADPSRPGVDHLVADESPTSGGHDRVREIRGGSFEVEGRSGSAPTACEREVDAAPSDDGQGADRLVPARGEASARGGIGRRIVSSIVRGEGRERRQEEHGKAGENGPGSTPARV